jgi:CubicO group peptidase (beta-lactamase class C family)
LNKSGVRYLEDPAAALDSKWDGQLPKLGARWASFWNKHARAAGFLSRPAGYDGPDTEYDFLCALPRERTHGANFFYKCADVRTGVWAAECALKRGYADLFSELIWTKIGAEHDAYVLCDGRTNSAFVSVGSAVTLRDFARIGQMLANYGRVGEQQVVPESYIADILNHRWIAASAEDEDWYSPHHTEVPTDLQSTSKNLGYRSWFWTWGDGQISAPGAFGQQLNVLPDANVVVAKFSTLFPESVAVGQRKEALQRVAMKEIVEKVAEFG